MSRLLMALAFCAATANAQPVSLAIVVQASPDTLRHADETQAALRDLLLRARPGDEFFSVLALDEPKLLADFTADPARIGVGLERTPAPRHNHLYDAMEFALRHLETARNPKRALLVIVSREDVASRLKPKALATQLHAGPVPLFVVSLIPRYPDDFVPTWFELTRMAARSGGDWWETASCRKLADTLRRVDFHRRGVVRNGKP